MMTDLSHPHIVTATCQLSNHTPSVEAVWTVCTLKVKSAFIPFAQWYKRQSGRQYPIKV